jgi:hypothetical protein
MKSETSPRLPRAAIGPAVATRLLATEPRLFLAVAGLVLLTRLPFLDAGYGASRDAWRVASAARLIATTRDYWASRFPPHPVHEIATAVIWRGGPVALNLTTAVVSAVGVAFFALAARRFGYVNWLPMTVALAMTPQIYINSTSTIDYLWALMFILAGLYFALRGQSLAAGLLVGLAIGSRITSGAMLLPLSIVVARHGDGGGRLRRAAILWLAACGVGALAFVPAFRRYGWDTFTFAEIAEYRPYDVLRRASLEVWGVVGTVGVCAAVAYQILRTARSRRRWALPEPRSYAYVWLIAVVLYAIAFLRLPHLPAYLIPAIPFALLLLHELLDRRAFVVACAALIVSPFVGIGPSGLQRGAILDDREKRTALKEAAERFVETGNRLPGRNVIVAGHWFAPVYVYVLEHPDSSSRYVYLLTAKDAERHRRRGESLYYLPGQRELNLERNGIDLRKYGARSLASH